MVKQVHSCVPVAMVALTFVCCVACLPVNKDPTESVQCAVDFVIDKALWHDHVFGVVRSSEQQIPTEIIRIMNSYVDKFNDAFNEIRFTLSDEAHKTAVKQYREMLQKCSIVRIEKECRVYTIPDWEVLFTDRSISGQKCIVIHLLVGSYEGYGGPNALQPFCKYDEETLFVKSLWIKKNPFVRSMKINLAHDAGKILAAKLPEAPWCAGAPAPSTTVAPTIAPTTAAPASSTTAAPASATPMVQVPTKIPTIVAPNPGTGNPANEPRSNTGEILYYLFIVLMLLVILSITAVAVYRWRYHRKKCFYIV